MAESLDWWLPYSAVYPFTSLLMVTPSHLFTKSVLEAHYNQTVYLYKECVCVA